MLIQFQAVSSTSHKVASAASCCRLHCFLVDIFEALSLLACNFSELSQLLIGCQLSIFLLTLILFPLPSLPDCHGSRVFKAPLVGDFLLLQFLEAGSLP